MVPVEVATDQFQIYSYMKIIDISVKYILCIVKYSVLDIRCCE